jgi:hypothetical protein
MNFQLFKRAVAEQFARMSQHALFRTTAPKDELLDTYLNSFPAGSNPIYRERTEHDCNCCKQFIRAVGNVVAIIDDKVVSIWDVTVAEPAYQAVADAMAAKVKSYSIDNVFLHYEKTAGTDKTFEQLADGQQTWNHFFVNIPAKFVVRKDSIPTALGHIRAEADVLLRSLREISTETVDTVLELIAQNSLYRGQEFAPALQRFRTVLAGAQPIRETFVWANVNRGNKDVTMIRNSVIGTLLVDLSDGVELDRAVASYEAKVAPANYKRPTALVTPEMIAAAKQKIEDLGLTSALERRYAHLEDISVNNVLFADRSARKVMGGNVFDDMIAASPVTGRTSAKVEEVSIEKFLADILPQAQSIEVLVENRHNNNFVSLIAPADPTAQPLFKWNNPFSWSYTGEFTDSIKERIKAAGGKIEGDLCCRLAWEYTDDLDFHMYGPAGEHIYFGDRRSMSGGMLDVDANGSNGRMEHPVENIVYADKTKMREGIYNLRVNNYSRRSPGVGFEVELDIEGQVHHIVYDRVVSRGEFVEVAQIKYSKANGLQLLSSLPLTEVSKTVWGIPTQTYRKVNVVTLSPNYWDDAVGNKHYMFMLDGCANDGSARGFFNEFLRADLNEHRKVIEMVGSKLKVASDERQLSGLGFSSTQRNDILCRVTGAFNRTIKITF